MAFLNFLSALGHQRSAVSWSPFQACLSVTPGEAGEGDKTAIDWSLAETDISSVLAGPRYPFWAQTII